MSLTKREQKEMKEAAVRLLQIADPLWTMASLDENNTDPEETEDGEKGEKEEESDGDGDGDDETIVPASNAVVAGLSNNSSTSSTHSAQPTVSVTARSVNNASLAALSASQQAAQQTRAAMTPRQRARLGYNTYPDLDAMGTSTGTLYMTFAERRTYRQTQRRRGAALVRAATTSGPKPKKDGSGGRKGPRGAGGGSGAISSH